MAAFGGDPGSGDRRRGVGGRDEHRRAARRCRGRGACSGGRCCRAARPTTSSPRARPPPRGRLPGRGAGRAGDRARRSPPCPRRRSSGGQEGAERAVPGRPRPGTLGRDRREPHGVRAGRRRRRAARPPDRAHRRRRRGGRRGPRRVEPRTSIRLFLVPQRPDRPRRRARRCRRSPCGYRLPPGGLDRYRAANPGASAGELLAEVMTDFFYRVPARPPRRGAAREPGLRVRLGVAGLRRPARRVPRPGAAVRLRQPRRRGRRRDGRRAAAAEAGRRDARRVGGVREHRRPRLAGLRPARGGRCAASGRPSRPSRTRAATCGRSGTASADPHPEPRRPAAEPRIAADVRGHRDPRHHPRISICMHDHA